jgi:hypothetical protein
MSLVVFGSVVVNVGVSGRSPRRSSEIIVLISAKIVVQVVVFSGCGRNSPCGSLLVPHIAVSQLTAARFTASRSAGLGSASASWRASARFVASRRLTRAFARGAGFRYPSLASFSLAASATSASSPSAAGAVGIRVALSSCWFQGRGRRRSDIQVVQIAEQIVDIVDIVVVLEASHRASGTGARGPHIAPFGFSRRASPNITSCGLTSSGFTSSRFTSSRRGFGSPFAPLAATSPTTAPTAARAIFPGFVGFRTGTALVHFRPCTAYRPRLGRLVVRQRLKVPFKVEIEDRSVQVVEILATRHSRGRVGPPLFASFGESEDIHIPFLFGEQIVERVARTGGPRRPSFRLAGSSVAGPTIASPSVAG